MSSFIYSLLEVNVLIVILFGGLMLTRRWLTYRQQRFSIVAIPLVAVLVVVLKSTLPVADLGFSIPIVELSPVVVGDRLNVATDTTGVVGVDWLYLTYFLMVGMLGLFMVYKLIKLASFFYRSNSLKLDGYRIYSVEGESSFSFFNHIQIMPSLNGQDKEIVLEHEKWHAKNFHTLDVLLLEIYHVLFWFNPVFFLMKRELICLHEFEVDALMYKRHKVNYMKFLVNYAFGSSSNYLLISRFDNKLTVKKRIKIMKTKTRTKRLFLFVIPFIALIFGSVQCTKEKDKEERRIEKPSIVYDSVEDEPKFVGGEEAMIAYLQSEIEYPKSAIDEGASGVIFVQFVVAKNGEIKDAKVMRAVHPELDREALRVVSEMPNWIPGKNKGVDVAVKYTVPISFQLN